MCEENWQKVLSALELKVATTTFNPWMISLKCEENILEPPENGKFYTLKSDQAFGIQVLQKKHLKDIEDAIFEVSGQRFCVNLVFEAPDVKRSKKPVLKPAEQYVIMQEQIDNLKQMHSFCGLNLKYTFENFVCGENSKFAYTAARAVAEAPGQKYNPLFIYGDVGLGKTHLMQAIGHHILKNFPTQKVKYTKAEEFMNQLIDCLKMGGDTQQRMSKFRDKYRNVDVLLIDDIQIIEGKKRTEEEIFNTFDTLFHAGKQIVFASDRPISSLAKTPERLKSRFEWGLSVDILAPDFEVRVAILENHAKRNCFEVSREVSEFLAKTHCKNVRELEGAYNRVSVYASIANSELTVELAKKVLGYSALSKKITPNDIIEKCAKYFNTSTKDILGTVRSKEIAHARQCAIYLSREITELSFPTLAQEFGKNHTTIMYSWEKVKNMSQDMGAQGQKLKSELEELERLIKSES
ncbi:chromosomal replication initiator protein [Candidatus Gastranaerophilus sp. (ex Termes propinquus)]|nr:chromosomal replication initiator protein [Candidatus Gastranaerophilus sp. (ex Termes propinquus)]